MNSLMTINSLMTDYKQSYDPEGVVSSKYLKKGSFEGGSGEDGQTAQSCF